MIPAGSHFGVTKPSFRLKNTSVSNWEKSRRPLFGMGAAALMLLVCACSPQLELATWSCKRAIASSQTADAGSNDLMEFDEPWSTGFENGVCDYYVGNGSCYTTGSASYRMVEAPVRTGHYAAAFTVLADGTKASTDSRCHRDGVLPQKARYTAWYYVPELANNSDNWNLIHFQGGQGPTERLDNLWDVSLVNDEETGALRLIVRSMQFLASSVTGAPVVPIGTWFSIEVVFKRASDATGEFSVYQNGTPILQATDLITDNTPYGQWYVGNLAVKQDPVESTLYVDDVSVRAEP